MVKTFDLKSLLIGVLLTMLVVAFTLIATTNGSPATWEYRVVSGRQGNDYQMKLNQAAQDGWEVVGIAIDPERRPYAVMKRAKAAGRPSWWMFWRKW